VEFFSLQQEVSGEAVASLPLAVHAFGESTRDPLEAAAAMLWLDLIITVDSMPAHLAGALGCPVWVMLKADADWRWMLQRRDTPWYPTMRLYRADRGWSATIQELAADLRAWRRQCGSALH
jgi:ADP-heptose:LPS heptosyltransferase